MSSKTRYVHIDFILAVCRYEIESLLEPCTPQYNQKLKVLPAVGWSLIMFVFKYLLCRRCERQITSCHTKQLKSFDSSNIPCLPALTSTCGMLNIMITSATMSIIADVGLLCRNGEFYLVLGSSVCLVYQIWGGDGLSKLVNSLLVISLVTLFSVPAHTLHRSY